MARNGGSWLVVVDFRVIDFSLIMRAYAIKIRFNGYLRHKIVFKA
jgi:hypothetical protein